ncbi:MAG: glycosyltransferase family 2 protein [Polaromonas sp.]|uniref:glycosyltransferase family 2 protein n=1 Tax=Polaromonas sp. TaxID=1869339 RepID=UPI003267E2BE
MDSPTDAAIVQTTTSRKLMFLWGKMLVRSLVESLHYRRFPPLQVRRRHGLSAMLSAQRAALVSLAKSSSHSQKRHSLASLSVIVITHNEARNIEACLRSVSFADQLAVLDSGSTDETLKIAVSLGAEVTIASEWRGFGIQKNRALAMATSEWVLSLDADERITPQLQAEILQCLAAPAFDVYSFPRLSGYCGQYMRHSGWYPDRVTRLFRRSAARFSEDLVHERLVTSLPVGQLQSPLMHESFRNFEAVLEKVNRYSSAGAQVLRDKGKSASISKAVGHGVWAFLRTYFLRLGFLDGRMGFVLAVSNAEGTYYRYLKLWLLQRQSPEGRNAGGTP